MTEKKNNRIKADKGFFNNISNEIRLVFRLLGDTRISWWLKLLPFSTLIYFVFPDLVPGPIDDAMVIGVGIYLFVELCPADIVEEHREALRNTIPGEWRDPNPKGEQNGDVVEGEFKDE